MGAAAKVVEELIRRPKALVMVDSTHIAASQEPRVHLGKLCKSEIGRNVRVCEEGCE